MAHLDRNTTLLDYINRLLQFGNVGDDYDTALGLMKWNDVTADQLNTRRASARRPIYRPIGRRQS